MAAYIVADIVVMHIFGDRIGLLQIVSDRVPVFHIGVLAGKEYQGKNRPVASTVCYLFVFLGVLAFASLALMDHYPHYRFSFMLMAVAAAIVVSVISVKLGEKSLFNKVLGSIGSMSLQVYLLHGMLTIVIVERTPLLRIPNKTVWIAVTLAATFFAAFVLKTICDLIRKVFNKAK